MSNCTNCKKTKSKCGCANKGLTTPPPCTTDTPVCPVPEKCAETFSAECIVYMGPDLPEIGLKSGDRVDNIIQRIFSLFLNPGCMLPGNPCQSPLGLDKLSVTSNSISIEWDAVALATSYTVSYKKAIDVSYIDLPPTVNTNQLISPLPSGLLSNTPYDIKVTSNCGEDPGSPKCSSLTIRLTTKQALL